MSLGAVSIGRRKYAVGLFWQPSPSGRVSQAAREAGREPGANAAFYAVRAGTKSGRVPQFGLAPPDPKFSVGMSTLAGTLANQQPGSWVGAFRLREGMVVVVVRDDLIAPDGDLLFADENAARERVMQEIALGGIQRVYAPEGWTITGADGIPLPLLLQGRAECPLRPVTIPRQWLILGGVATAVLLVGLGVALFLQQQREAELAAQRAKMEAEARAREELSRRFPSVGVSDYPPPPRLWEDRPLAAPVILACRDTAAQVAVAQAGFRITRVTCTQNGLNVDWGRVSGTPGIVGKDLSVAEDGFSASQALPLPALAPRSTEALLAPAKVTERILRQNWPVQFIRLPDDPPPPPPPGREDLPPPPPPPWTKRGVTVSLPGAPWAYLNWFDNFPGLIIEKLDWNGTQWIVEGVIYEKRFND